MMNWQIQFTRAALGTLREISDRRIRGLIVSRVEELGEEPHALSTPLQGELSGFRSIRAVGQRYRIVFHIDEERRQVTVIAVGIRREGHRRDIYALAQRLVRLGLVEPPQD